jgi:2-polyprenyl-3-methyl-5-hydroxy-6-metoxy-1,4-benzoquinol methylase
MDQPDLEPQRHIDALKGLRRINRISNAASHVWKPVGQLAGVATRPIRILDLACGAGDLPIALAKMGVRRGKPVDIHGCDKSPTALEFARDSARRQQVRAGFFELDLFTDDIPSDFDVIICSLFLHHLDERFVIRLLQQMRQVAGRMIVVADLRRCYAGFLLALGATRILTRSPVVHVDGPRSVRAAFTIPEMREIAGYAGLDGAHLTRTWPFRFLLTWQRT